MNDIERIMIYADIESVLDLRQGFLTTLEGMTYGKLVEIIESPEYNNRLSDNFVKYTEAGMYDKAIASGKKEIVINATITHTLSVINAKVSRSFVKNNTEGKKAVPCFWLNIYPFKFTEEELILIRDAMFEKLGSNLFIEIVDMEPSKVSPALFDDMDFFAAYIYDFAKWSNLHSVDLVNYKLDSLEIFFPTIFKEDVPDEEFSKLEKNGVKDIYTIIEKSLAKNVRVNFLPLVFYSNYLFAEKTLKGMEEMMENEVFARSKIVREGD